MRARAHDPRAPRNLAPATAIKCITGKFAYAAELRPMRV